EDDSVRAPFNRARELELKNFYDMSGQRIDPQTLVIKVRQGNADPPNLNVTLQDGTPVPYLEALGLDNLDESGSTPLTAHDGKLDGSLVTSNSRVFVDYESGTLFLPDLRPFAPRIDPQTGKPFERAVNNALSRRVHLDGSLGIQNAANTDVYDKYNPQRNIDSRYFIDVDFT